MKEFFLKRFLTLFITIFGVILITFFLARLFPNDPVMLVVGSHPTQEQIDTANQRYGFDKPMIEQFILYLGNLIQGDLGTSLRTKQAVANELSHRFMATFELVTFSLFISILFGFPLGILSSYYRKTKPEKAIRGFAFSSIALPIFWSGMLLQMLFFGKLGWLPLQGRLSPYFQNIGMATNSGILVFDTLITGNWPLFWDALKHLILPVLCLALSSIGIIIRTVRSAVLETIHEDHFYTYQTLGFHPLTILFRLAFKNSLVLSLTIIGLVYGMLLGGSFLVETIFDWPGLGHFAILSITTNDFPSIMGVTILYAVVYLSINFLVDVAYHYIDPRIRFAEK